MVEFLVKMLFVVIRVLGAVVPMLLCIGGIGLGSIWLGITFAFGGSLGQYIAGAVPMIVGVIAGIYIANAAMNEDIGMR